MDCKLETGNLIQQRKSILHFAKDPLLTRILSGPIADFPESRFLPRLFVLFSFSAQRIMVSKEPLTKYRSKNHWKNHKTTYHKNCKLSRNIVPYFSFVDRKNQVKRNKYRNYHPTCSHIPTFQEIFVLLCSFLPCHRYLKRNRYKHSVFIEKTCLKLCRNLFAELFSLLVGVSQ